MSKIKKIKTIINGLDDGKKMEKTSDKSKNGYLEFKRRGQSKSNRLKEIEEKNKIAEKKKIEEIRINNIIEKAVKNISIKMEFEHKRKIDKIISSHNQEIKRINESLNGQVLNEIYNENKILKSETEENNRLIEKLITSNKLLNIDKTKSENEKQQLEEKIKSLELKLQNCQKVLKNTPNFKNKIIESENDLEGKTLKSNDFDGSKGWHELARENGKFGSLPSFDNYSDEYLDDSKNGFE